MEIIFNWNKTNLKRFGGVCDVLIECKFRRDWGWMKVCVRRCVYKWQLNDLYPFFHLKIFSFALSVLLNLLLLFLGLLLPISGYRPPLDFSILGGAPLFIFNLALLFFWYHLSIFVVVLLVLFFLAWLFYLSVTSVCLSCIVSDEYPFNTLCTPMSTVAGITYLTSIPMSSWIRHSANTLCIFAVHIANNCGVATNKNVIIQHYNVLILLPT